MREMRVINKNFTMYGTRRLCPGDSFLAADRHAQILKLTGLADYAPDTEPDTLTILRERFAIMAGHKPDERWRERRLQQEISRLTKEA